MTSTPAAGKTKLKRDKEKVHIQPGGQPDNLCIKLYKNPRHGPNRIQWINDDHGHDYTVVFPKGLFEGIRIFANGDPPELQLASGATPPGAEDAEFPYWILPARGRRRKRERDVKGMTEESMSRSGPVIIVSD